MFEQLYTSPFAVARHRAGPLLKERLAFLAHLRNQGYMTNALRKRARSLLVIARTLGVPSRPRKTVTLNEVKRKTVKHKDPYLYGLGGDHSRSANLLAGIVAVGAVVGRCAAVARHDRG